MNNDNKTIDFTLEGKTSPLGYFHPITKISQEICDIFRFLGYSQVKSPEIDNEYNNFNKLNIPPNHPARDMHDTFYLNYNNLLLRTHTSNTQIRILESIKNNDLSQEVKFFTIGKVYRRDVDDATHSHEFNQMEGVMVGKNISFPQLKGNLKFFLQKIFGKNYPLRFRPSYFPFTKLSVEVDLQCINCQGEGCNICKKTGWIEILGAGLIHPQVLKNCGYNPEEWSGFAFGCGIERLLMIKYRIIKDIRDLHLNNVRLLSQF